MISAASLASPPAWIMSALLPACAETDAPSDSSETAMAAALRVVVPFGRVDASNWLMPLVADVSDGRPARTAAWMWMSGTRWSGSNAMRSPFGSVWTVASAFSRRVLAACDVAGVSSGSITVWMSRSRVRRVAARRISASVMSLIALICRRVKSRSRASSQLLARSAARPDAVVSERNWLVMIWRFAFSISSLRSELWMSASSSMIASTRSLQSDGSASALIAKSPSRAGDDHEKDDISSARPLSSRMRR